VSVHRDVAVDRPGEFDELRGAPWRRLLAAARRRLDKTGGEPTGAIGLTDPDDDERWVVERVLGRPGEVRRRRLTVPMAELDRTLREAYGTGLLAALARLDAPPPPVDRESALQGALRSRHAGDGWFTGWLGEISRDGTVARLVREGNGVLLAQAAAVLDRLPARDVALPVLAEWATGDPTALSGTPLAGLVLRALVLRQGSAPPVGRAAESAVWGDAGVVADDLASQVLVLNLRVIEDHQVARWLNDAASSGVPFRITLHQLVDWPVTPDAGELFVCRSPAVTRAAAAPGCAPLVCTEDRVSVACRRLLGAAAAAGARLRWHSDFDWTGVRLTAAATARYAAEPWRMGAQDYLDAVAAGGTEPLGGTPSLTPWDERLAAEMTREGRAVREERLLRDLLADLHA
jgi:uncharacterized protein (TIGR02679 family)